MEHILSTEIKNITAARKRGAHPAGISCMVCKSEHSINQNYDQANLLISDFSEIEFEKMGEIFNRNAGCNL